MDLCGARMQQQTSFRVVAGFVFLLVSGSYTLPSYAGVSPPIPPPTPVSEPVTEEFPDACLGDGQFFTIIGDDLFIDDGMGGAAPVTDAFLAELNEGGLCSQLGAGSGVISEEIARLLLTEYFNRFGSALQGRIFANLFGGSGGVAGRNNAGQMGRAAGDGMPDWNGWSPWISYGHTWADNDLPSTRYDANQDNVLFGIDYTVSDRFIFGISGAYEKNDIDTRFNLGQMQVDGFTIAPYAAYLLTDNVSIDAAFGYSDLSIDQFRIEPGGARVTGNTDSSRWFVMSNLNALYSYGSWSLTGRAGIIYSEESQDGFTEIGGVTAQTFASRNVEFGQLNFGGEAAYSAHALEPFASILYEYDFEQGDSAALNANQAQRRLDDDNFRMSLGLRYFGENGFSAILEWSRIFDREYLDSQTINIMARMQF